MRAYKLVFTISEPFLSSSRSPHIIHFPYVLTTAITMGVRVQANMGFCNLHCNLEQCKTSPYRVSLTTVDNLVQWTNPLTKCLIELGSLPLSRESCAYLKGPSIKISRKDSYLTSRLTHFVTSQLTPCQLIVWTFLKYHFTLAFILLFC